MCHRKGYRRLGRQIALLMIVIFDKWCRFWLFCMCHQVLCRFSDNSRKFDS